MRDKHRDQWESWQQRIREWWIGVDESVTGPDSRFRETAIFIRSRPLYLRWTLVIVSVGISLAVGLPFSDVLLFPSQLMLYLPAVMVTALYGGSLAGWAAAALGAACSAFFYFPAANLVREHNGALIALPLYFLAAGMVIVLAHTQERFRQRIRDVQHDLEDRVVERTRELQSANEELAGFCYSISHDLRAPMRNIVSSSRILQEDYGAQLDDEGVLRLRGMAQSANRLSSLVDDLLDYARLSNATLRAERIDLSRMVEEIFDHASTQPWRFRRLATKVQPGLITGGDSALVSLALRSLIDNACKYSKPGQVLSLEFGETRYRGHLWYFLRDDGIGFDMQYARKIFEPFQRLHRDADVPGTGIGLANVKRIVERHNGEIFAESVPGSGSTFYWRMGNRMPTNISESAASSHRVVMAEEA